MSEEPKAKNKLLNLKGWWWKLLLVIIGLMMIGVFDSAGLPKCDSSNAKNTLTDAFDQSQFARSLNLSAVQISEAKEIAGSTEKQRNCNSKIAMNNTETVSVDYKMNLQDNGGFMLEFKVQE